MDQLFLKTFYTLKNYSKQVEKKKIFNLKKEEG